LAEENGYLVPAIARAVDILEFLAHSRRGLSISEISRNLQIPKSSTYLALATLEKKGFLQRNAQSGKYSFGPKLVSLSRRVLEHLDLREVARPFMNALMIKTGSVVHLAVLERNEAVLIDRVEPAGQSAGADWVGRRLDINCTGVGKALAAFLSEEQFDTLITAKQFARHNDNTIVSIRDLKKELARVREQGFAVDDEEDEIGLRCIGVPILDAHQTPIAAISLAGTTEQIPFEKVHGLANVLTETARDISLRLISLRA
jgi:DNA-binding IclR family transcriptional regulator